MTVLPARVGTVGVHHRADDAVRRCDQYRRALRVAAMNVSPEALLAPPVAAWARRRGVGVDTGSARQLAIALNAGIAPARITLHCNDDAAYVRWGIQAGVGRFVVGSEDHVEEITRGASTPRRVLVDLSTCPDPHVAMRIVAVGRLELVGVHHLLTPLARQNEVTVASMVTGIACLRERYGHIVTCLSFAGIPGDLTPRQLRAVAEDLEATVEDACARLRYPRPALVIAVPDIDRTRT